VNVQDITGGSTWAIAAAAFSNPMYLSGPLGKSDNSNSTGFQITPGAAVVVGFEGTYSGATVVHEQTMDPTGSGGWFSVEGTPSDGGAATSTGAASGTAYIFTCIGVQHRIKVTDLTTGALTARIRLEGEAISTAGGSGAGGATEATLLDVLADTNALVVAAEDTATVNVAQDTSVVMVGDVAVTPKFEVIAASSSGDNTLVAAVATKQIRVLAFRVNGSAAVNWKFQSETGGDITGLFYCAAAGQGEIGAYSPVGLFETVAGEALQLNLSAAVAVGGYLVYIEV